MVAPGAGGILPDIFYPPSNEVSSQLKIQGQVINIPVHSPVIINPRGFRAYVRNDTFFQSIPLILEKETESIFLCPSMKGVEEAERWVAALGIGDAVHLLPRLTPSEMAELLRRSQISVSMSEHDGTPNTLLEAMACGCIPIAGDIDSIREWIQSEKNGLLVDPSHPAQLAEAVLKVLNSPEFVADAKEINLELIRDRAIRSEVMARVEGFYQEVV